MLSNFRILAYSDMHRMNAFLVLIILAIVCHGQPMGGVQDSDDTHIHIYLPPENDGGTFPENADCFDQMLYCQGVLSLEEQTLKKQQVS